MSGEAEGGESDRVPLMAPIHTDTELEENLESRHRDLVYLLILWCVIRLPQIIYRCRPTSALRRKSRLPKRSESESVSESESKCTSRGSVKVERE